MTYDEAITKLVNTSDELKNIIIQLQTENAFLVETIEKNNLGQIKSERQFLLRENEKCKKESQFAIKEANQIKKEYEYKISEVDDILADVKKKQSEIVLYINNEAEKKIEGIKAEYKNQKESNNRALEQCVLENEKKMHEYKIFLEKKVKKYLLVATIGVFVGFIGFIVNFM